MATTGRGPGVEPGVIDWRRGEAWRAWHEGGAAVVAVRCLNHVLAHRVELGSTTFFRRELVEDPPPSAAGMDITIYPAASLMDARLVLQGCDPSRPAAVVLERLRRGDVCFLAIDARGRPVHSDWATGSLGHVPELAMDLIPRRGEVYLYDAFSPPEVRGRRLFGVVLDHMFCSLRAAGFRAAYSYVRGDSPVGLQSACKRLRPVGTLWYLRLAGHRPLVFGRRAPGLPELLRRDAGRRDGGGGGMDGHVLLVDGVRPPRALALAGARRGRTAGEASAR